MILYRNRALAVCRGSDHPGDGPVAAHPGARSTGAETPPMGPNGQLLSNAGQSASYSPPRRRAAGSDEIMSARNWRRSELQIVRDHYPARGMHGVHRLLPHRSPGAIKARAHMLGVRSEKRA